MSVQNVFLFTMCTFNFFFSIFVTCMFWYIAEIFKTAQPLTIRTKDNLVHSEKTTVPNKMHSSTTSGIQPMYLLVGVGVILTLFLFIIIIELCNKAKSSKAKTVFRQRRYETRNSSNQCSRAANSQNNEGPSHPPNDVEYAEVNEVAEMQPTNASNALSQGRPANSNGNSLVANGNNHILN